MAFFGQVFAKPVIFQRFDRASHQEEFSLKTVFDESKLRLVWVVPKNAQPLLRCSLPCALFTLEKKKLTYNPV
jgi:hypothetical protein